MSPTSLNSFEPGSEEARRAVAKDGKERKTVPHATSEFQAKPSDNKDNNPRTPATPWFAPTPPLTAHNDKPSIAIIGGGVAGASLADAARRRGIAATIFDPAGLAAGASGNPGGLIMPRLDLGDGPAAQFFKQAYLFALATLHRLGASKAGFYNPCGVALSAKDADGREKLARLVEADALPPDYMEQRDAGLFFPQAGVVAPSAYVKALAGDTSIVARRVIDIEPAANGTDRPVITLDTDEKRSFDAVVIANGASAPLQAVAPLPFTDMAGQIEHFPKSPAPAHAIAAGPYAAPAPGGGVLIGATYERLPDGAEAAPRPAISKAATQENITAAQTLAPDIAADLRVDDARPRAAVRRQTPDRLPVVGAVPDWAFYAEAYGGLRQGKRGPYPPGRVLSGLYLLSGLGSRGLVTAPLCAEIVIAALAGAPAPVALDVANALHPARFFVRDLKRGRV